jgi:hypothetical protein
MRWAMWNGLGFGLLSLTFASPAGILADTIELRDGKLIQGTFMGGTQTTVRFQTQAEIKVIPVADIVALTFDRPAPATLTTPATPAVPATPAAGAARPTVPAVPATPAAGATQPTVPAVPATGATAAAQATAAQAGTATPAKPTTPVPAALPPKPSLAAGTRIQVRINEAIDSTTHKVGRKFTGVLTADLRAGAEVLVPEGSPVAGELAAGVAPQPALRLVLTGITVSGKLKPVTTDDVIAVSAPVTKKSRQSGAVGAVLGAITGGSEGAAKGLDAAALASVATKGDKVDVPANSVIEFQLKTVFTP